MQINVEYSDIISLFLMIPRRQGARIGEKIMEILLQCLDRQYSSHSDYVSCLMDKKVNLPHDKYGPNNSYITAVDGRLAQFCVFFTIPLDLRDLKLMQYIFIFVLIAFTRVFLYYVANVSINCSKSHCFNSHHFVCIVLEKNA